MNAMRSAAGWLLLAGALAITLAETGCGGPPDASKPQATTPTRVTAPPAKAAPATVTEKPESLEILSVLSVEHEVDVLAQRDGVVTEILLDAGNHAAKGAVLARLDDRELLAKLDRARADLAVAQENVKYNEAELRAKQAAYRRAQEMRKLGLNSDADLEEAEFKAQGAGYDLESWRAVVERTRADARVLELEREKTLLRAPFSGVVARRYIRAGQNVLKDEKCFRLSQLAPLQVRFLVPETAGRPPKSGERVEVAPVGERQRTYSASVVKVSPTVDAASGSYDVTATLTGAKLGELRPGMSVRVLWRPAPSKPKL